VKKKVKKKTLAQDVKSIGINITERPVDKGLGFTDTGTGEIVIDNRLPWVGKNVVLMHELLHVVDTHVINHKIRKTRISHNWIHHAAWALLAILVELDLYKGVDKKAIRRFCKANSVTLSEETKRKGKRKSKK
jgi:hypothetical protein